MEQAAYKKSYTFHEFFDSIYNGIRTIKHLNKSKKKKEMSQEFIERIMLAVTQVNGCAVCSYAHTKWALEAGISSEEIGKLLAGVADSIPADEMPAILFAQHYADTKGHPSKDSWERIAEVYGTGKAYGILGAVREIMIGNIMGAPASAFMSRLKGKVYKNSNLFKELGMILSVLIYFPVALIYAVIANLLKKPIINFAET